VGRLAGLLVAGNWKMHTGVAQAVALVQALAAEGVGAAQGVRVVVCPPFTALDAVHRVLPAGVDLGAQDVFWEDEGAYTGEVSPAMLAELGCRYVLVGHSERRRVLGETDAMVAAKLRACWRHGLVPLLCVGEREAEREEGHAADVLRRQLRAALGDAAPAPLCVAYEPVWAIGTGRPAGPAECAAALAVVRRELEALWGREAAAVPCLYGGSVGPDNCRGFWHEGDADGVLVGGVSLRAPAFAAICRTAAEDAAARGTGG
jgi:triosephosphate isomerase